jgi:hypothetical protein
MIRVSLLALGFLASFLVSARAQITVDIKLSRSLYVRYEPLVCTVEITNMSGRTLELADTAREKWFGFNIETVDGRPIPPINPAYGNDPMTIENGQKISRSINLTPLFPISEFGTYRVRAAVYSSQLGKYFESPKLNIDITEGRKIEEQPVGVPEGAGPGRNRTFTILAHRLSRTTVLYLRVEDRDEGKIYCTTQLGRFITSGNPEMKFDRSNNAHILQNAAPKAFLYSIFDINGKVIKQQGYQSGKERPHLVRKADGSIEVAGGIAYDVNAKPPEQTLPKLDDRPVPMPTPQGKATPEEKRPDNLLSR